MANNFIDKSLNTLSDLSNSITGKYDKHIKKKAIEQVDENIIKIGLKIDDIDSDDYEAMISEEMIKIKEEYSSNTAKVGLSLLGLDLLFG